ncbi:uncharacterized protein LOC122816737 isoform X2 [Protopterus annectens]|uniref:uncharacterized protein LOC122816737 isoform X2 n=1 Tax=Protopterus annectens TaxID=7888 RepID=UPI001CFA1464|nr:uncharacterized protein LOC122816737 isoform X2 [Protopterus annectens]
MQTMALLHLCGALIYIILGSQPAIAGKCGPYAFNHYCAGVSSSPIQSNSNSACTTSLKEAACSHDNITDDVLAHYLYCFATDGTSLMDQDGFVVLMHDIPLAVLGDAMDLFSVMISGEESFNSDAQHVIFTAVWERLKNEPDYFDSTFMTHWFQQKMHILLKGVTVDQLNCMTLKQISCNSFEVVVQALDDVYCKSDDAEKIAIADWISSTLSLIECSKSTSSEWLLSNWKSFSSVVSYQTLTSAWSEFDGSSVITLLYPEQLAEYAISSGVCGVSSQSNADICQGIHNILTQNNLDYLDKFMTTLSSTAAQASQQLNITFARSVLKTTFLKLKSDSSDVCASSIQSWFQEKLQSVMWSINVELLGQIPEPKDCSSFQAIYNGINMVYSDLDDDTNKQIVMNRLSFLKEQKKKEGDACTYLSKGSRQWLDDNIGHGVYYVSFSDLKYLNPNFDGMTAVDEFNSQQLAELMFDINVFNNPETLEQSYEEQLKVKKIMDSLTQLETRSSGSVEVYMIRFSELASQVKLEQIQHAKVRDIIWKNLYDNMISKINTYTTEELRTTCNVYLTYFYSSITTSQLNYLLVSSCEQQEIFVSGFDIPYDFLPKDIQDAFAHWISNSLKYLKCDTDNVDWLHIHYKRFSQNENIMTLLQLNQNINVFDHLNVLSADQMATVAVFSDTLTNITKVKEIFNELITRNGNDDLLSFWTSLSSTTKEPIADKTVSYYMLSTTVEQVKEEITTYTDEQYNKLFNEQLVPVLPTIDASVLDEIPQNISCTSLRAVMSGLNKGYFYFQDSNKEDVTDFLNKVLNKKGDASSPADSYCSSRLTYTDWIKTTFYSFTGDVNYAELNMYRDGTGNPIEVLNMLTSKQTGQMLATSDILENKAGVAKVFDFLSKQPVESVRQTMEAFSSSVNETSVSIDGSIGKFILSNYLSIMSSEINTASVERIEQIFDSEINPLVQFFEISTLTLLVPADCSRLGAFVSGFNTAYEQLPEGPKAAIVNWIVQYIQNLKGCQAPSTEIWTREYWGKFIQDADISVVLTVNKKYNAFEVLTQLNTKQLAETFVTSGGLKDVSKAEAILDAALNTEEPQLTDIQSFLNDLNFYLSQQHVPGIKLEEVRKAVEVRIFTNMTMYYNEFTNEKYKEYFEDYLQPLLPSIDKTELDEIPNDISCEAYFSIVSGLNKVFELLNSERQINVYNFIDQYLENKVKDTGKACTDYIADSNDFLEQVYGMFCAFATVKEFEGFYSSFNPVDTLPKLTSKQLAETTVEKKAYNNVFTTAKILAEVQQKPVDEIHIYYTTFGDLMQSKKVVIEDTNAKDLLWSVAINTFSSRFTSFTETDYENFCNFSSTIITSIQIKDLDLIPKDIGCGTLANFVKPLSDQYDQLSSDQRNAIQGKVINQLQEISQREGSACTKGITDKEWVSTYIGEFVQDTSVTVMTKINSNLDVLDILTQLDTVQKVDVVIQKDALQNEETFFKVFKTVSDTKDLGTFFDELNSKSPDSLKNCDFGGEILYEAVNQLSTEITTFTKETTTFWLDVRFENIIQNFNKTILEIIPKSISCETFQTISGAVNQAYDEIESENRKGIYEYSYDYLSTKVNKKSSVACGSTSDDSRTWLQTNIGRYSEHAEYAELTHLKQNFDGYEVIDILVPNQIADMVIETNALNDEDKICQVLTQVDKMDESQVYEFLVRFDYTATKKQLQTISNGAIRKNMLLHFIKSMSTNSLLYDPASWTKLLQPLNIFLASIDAEVLSYMSPTSCESFQVIVQHLSDAYSFMTPDSINAVYEYCLNFLKNQLQTSGSACAKSSVASSSSDWSAMNFGAFSGLLNPDDLSNIFSDYDWMSQLSTLNANQLAGLTAKSVNLGNVTTVTSIMNALSERKPQDGLAFLASFKNLAEKENVNYIHPELSAVIFKAVFQSIIPLAPSFDSIQWATVFGTELSLFSAGVTKDLLNSMPQQITCTNLQSMVSGFSPLAADMSEDAQQSMYDFINGVLTLKKKNGSPCTDNAKNDADWIQKNYGAFRINAQYTDYTSVNPNFNGLNALEVLSPAQSAQLCFVSDALQNKNSMVKIMSKMDTDSFSEFMTEFNIIFQQKGLSFPNVDVQKAMLSEALCILSMSFSNFLSSDYKEWFQDKLKVFVNVIDSSHLASLSKSLPCDSLHELVIALANGADKAPSEDVCNYITTNLKSQLQATGSACASHASDDSQWLNDYFGGCAKQVQYSELVSLKSDFKGAAVASQMSWSQLGGFVAQSKTSVTLVSSALNEIHSSSDQVLALGTFLENLRSSMDASSTSISNAKVNYAIASSTFSILSTSMADMDVTTLKSWLDHLGEALATCNSTLLEYVPYDMSCENFQTFVSYLSRYYGQMPPVRHTQIYHYQVAFLLNKYNTDGSACEGNTSGIKDWLAKNFGSFCPQIQISDFHSSVDLSSVSLPDDCPAVC